MAVTTGVPLHVRFPTHTLTGEVPIFFQAGGKWAAEPTLSVDHRQRGWFPTLEAVRKQLLWALNFLQWDYRNCTASLPVPTLGVDQCPERRVHGHQETCPFADLDGNKCLWMNYGCESSAYGWGAAAAEMWPRDKTAKRCGKRLLGALPPPRRQSLTPLPKPCSNLGAKKAPQSEWLTSSLISSLASSLRALNSLSLILFSFAWIHFPQLTNESSPTQWTWVWANSGR